MARARNLKPGFFTNDRLGEIEPLARLLFQGLWCHADREGRLANRPKKLRAEILPYDECDVANLLLQLAAAGFIVCYTVGDAQYIEIVNFAKHQKPHPKEPASLIPAPSGRELPRREQDEPGKETARHETYTEGTALPSLPSSSLLPHPLPPIAPRKRGGRVLDEGNLKIFEEWYAIYPLRKARLSAEKAFLAALARASPAELMIGAARYRDECAGKEARYIAHPSTWLNAGRWKDELPHGSTATGTLHALSERRRPTAPPRPEDLVDVGT